LFVRRNINKSSTHDIRKLIARDRELILGSRTLIMGVVNVTPDSFSDGGEAFGLDAAVARSLKLVDDGADIIDIGGESTRPGSNPVSLDEELFRVIPVIKALSGRIETLISIDTYKADVAREALAAGAHIVNDISAGNFDPELPGVVAATGAAAVLMHIKGTPRNMQINPTYDNLLREVKSYLTEAVERFETAGVTRERILVDPGIGFGKRLEHNLELICNLYELQGIAAGVLFGPSRKSFIGLLTDKPVDDRLAGTVASITAGVLFGADVVRVHDVETAVDALKIIDGLSEFGRFDTPVGRG